MHAWEPPPIFSWDVVDGACGVAGTEAAARARLVQALLEGAPGAYGEVRRISLCRLTHDYAYGQVLAAAGLECVSGTVQWWQDVGLRKRPA